MGIVTMKNSHCNSLSLGKSGVKIKREMGESGISWKFSEGHVQKEYREVFLKQKEEFGGRQDGNVRNVTCIPMGKNTDCPLTGKTVKLDTSMWVLACVIRGVRIEL